MRGKSTRKITRRRALQAGVGVAVGGTMTVSATVGVASPNSPLNAYQTLGIPRVINATGTVTALGGSIMPPEVVAAWADAARHFVDLLDLQDKVGERIAKLLGVEAALVTTGAAGALLLGTAAVVTRGDPRAIAAFLT